MWEVKRPSKEEGRWPRRVSVTRMQEDFCTRHGSGLWVPEASARKAVARVFLSKGVFPCCRVQLLPLIPSESTVIAVFWVNGPTAFLLFSYVKGESDLWCPSSDRFIKLSFKAWETMSSSSSHKSGLELLLLSKTYQRFAHKREIWNAVLVITN